MLFSSNGKCFWKKSFFFLLFAYCSVMSMLILRFHLTGASNYSNDLFPIISLFANFCLHVQLSWNYVLVNPYVKVWRLNKLLLKVVFFGKEVVTFQEIQDLCKVLCLQQTRLSSKPVVDIKSNRIIKLINLQCLVCGGDF